MKKAFLFLFATILLTSCGNENEDTSSINQRTYKVAFKVSGFEVDTKPLKSSLPELNYCQYAIYKDNGEMVINKTLLPQEFDHANLQIVEELPIGKYHIAILTAQKHVLQNSIEEYSIFEPSNYETDYCFGNKWLTRPNDNSNIYYETLTYNVSADSDENNPISVVLQPMWSQLDVKVTDATTYTLPEGTTLVGCQIEPLFYGFSIRDKKPIQKVASPIQLPIQDFIPVSQFRENKGIFGTIASQTEGITIKLIYLHTSSTEAYKVVGEKTIYRGDIDVAKHITFTGVIGGEKGTGSQSFGISITGLKDGGEIPFTE